jgi:hypothetical protein
MANEQQGELPEVEKKLPGPLHDRTGEGRSKGQRVRKSWLVVIQWKTYKCIQIVRTAIPICHREQIFTRKKTDSLRVFHRWDIGHRYVHSLSTGMRTYQDAHSTIRAGRFRAIMSPYPKPTKPTTDGRWTGRSTSRPVYDRQDGWTVYPNLENLLRLWRWNCEK